MNLSGQGHVKLQRPSWWGQAGVLHRTQRGICRWGRGSGGGGVGRGSVHPWKKFWAK